MGPWGAIIGAGLGLIKGKQDEIKQQKQAELAAETARYSPWTGMQPQQVEQADVAGSMMQGGMAGFGMGQNIASAQGQDAMNQSTINKNAALARYYDRSGKPMVGPEEPAQ